ncbi:MAG: arginase [Proteobacteria bacterium]|nr:arginase [Pseudomonadota bacterium]
MPSKKRELIGAAFGLGAAYPQAQEGPKTLQETVLKSAPWRTLLTPQTTYTTENKLSYEERLAHVEAFNQQLAKEVIASEKNHFPIVLGGDHSIAIGTWSALVCAKKAQMDFGLIWIDAHMDSHTEKTTPSFNIHGMPLAALLGYGEAKLVNLVEKGPKLNPKHIVLIGVRSFEPQEAELLRNLNVTIYFMAEVKQRGFKTVFNEAIQQVSQNTKYFGVSIDVDAFDPSIAPGTGAKVQDGIIEIEGVVQALQSIKNKPNFAALEIAEFDPTRDDNQMTARLVQQLVTAIL